MRLAFARCSRRVVWRGAVAERRMIRIWRRPQLLLQMTAAYGARLGRKRRVRLGSVRAAGARQCRQAAWGRPGTASIVVVGRVARCNDGEEGDDWRRAVEQPQGHEQTWVVHTACRGVPGPGTSPRAVVAPRARARATCPVRSMTRAKLLKSGPGYCVLFEVNTVNRCAETNFQTCSFLQPV